MTAIIKAPVKVVKKAGAAVKTTVKQAIEPATSKGTSQVFLGALLAPPLSNIYGWVYNASVAKLPIPNWAHTIIKIGAPLIPVAIVSKTKLPAGNLINGALIGVCVAQIVNLILSFFNGGISLGGTGTGTITDAGQLSTTPSEWLDKFF